MTMRLQEKLDAYRKSSETQVPREKLEIMHRATETLRDSGILERAVRVGDRAPNFSLKNTGGREVALEDLLLRGPVVLSFYRGRW
jgi:hypothetical protein